MQNAPGFAGQTQGQPQQGQYQNQNQQDMEPGFEWDSTIQNDGTDYVVLPPAVYPYTIGGVERHRHGGSANLPPCHKAEVSVIVHGGDEYGDVTVKTNLFLHPKCEGFLCAYFTSIGARKSGEPLVMDFPKSVGCTGYVKMANRKDRDDPSKVYNDVKAFLSPEDGARAIAKQNATTSGGAWGVQTQQSAPPVQQQVQNQPQSRF